MCVCVCVCVGGNQIGVACGCWRCGQTTDSPPPLRGVAVSTRVVVDVIKDADTNCGQCCDEKSIIYTKLGSVPKVLCVILVVWKEQENE